MPTTHGNEGGAGDDLDMCECKVGRNLQKYALDRLNTELTESWTAPKEERSSLRELADYFNRQVLQAAAEEAGLNPVDEMVETWYTLLTNDESNSGSKTEIRWQLEQDGLDVDQVTADFVSYQTINRHLKQCHELERETDDETDSQNVRRRVQSIYALENKISAVTNDILGQLHRSGRISLRNFEVFVDINILCSDCGAHHNISDIVENQGCQCDMSD